MRRLPFIGALVAAIVGPFKRKLKTPALPVPYEAPRRSHGGGSRKMGKRARAALLAARKRRLHRWMWRLRRKFAKNALARYGLDELTPEGKPNPENIRVMRNARKQERQAR